MVERLSAVALIPLTLWAIFSLVHIETLTQVNFNAWLQSPLNAVLLLATVVVMYWHAAMGMKVIVDDYISCSKTNCLVSAVLKFGFITLGIASVVSIVKIAF
jgi:succinate dehydrogenase / fumarate reductase membrane anchor subunit